MPVLSKMEYEAPVLITSDTFKKAMNGIQYKAIRTIYKQPQRCSSKILHVKANNNGWTAYWSIKPKLLW